MELRSKAYQIRSVQQKDMQVLIQLCEEHARYENSTYASEGKLEQLAEHLFAENSKILCWVVDFSGRIEGYVVLAPEFSTWDAGYFYHMDCLFLTEKCRGFGIGTEILNKIADYAKAEGIQQIQWQTPANNKGAINFYHKNGAVSKEKLRFYLNTRIYEKSPRR